MALAREAMIAGHFGFAAAIKAKEPQIPLAALMGATMWLDIVFAPLLALKIEGIATAPDAAGPGYASNLISAPYTHSLVGALILSALYGAFFIRRGHRAAAVLALVAFSHWIFDLIMHRPDMPILPANIGDLPLLGFGLWQSPTASALLELVFVVVGFGLYWRAARRPPPPRGSRGCRPTGSAALPLQPDLPCWRWTSS